MARHVGIYPGTFDPIHRGHIDIIARAMRLLDHLVVGIAINEDKGPMFSLAERVEMVERELATIKGSEIGTFEVKPFDNLLVDFAHEVGARTVVRGIRTMADFEYEMQLVGMNAAMRPELETIFLVASPHYQSIASRLVKEIARLNGEVASFVPQTVAKALRARLGK